MTLKDREYSKHSLPTGTKINRFVIINPIGKGGMGVVYKAYDPELDRRIAVKLLSIQPLSGQTISRPRDRLLREAQALAKLSHPNVVSVYDVGTYDRGVYVAMEFIEGDTLRNWLEQTLRTPTEILQIFIAAGEGLHAAHEQRIIHRDFKPENVMVNEKGRVWILDFGLAKAAEFDWDDFPSRPSELETPTEDWLLNATLTNANAQPGTALYMAPEQFVGHDATERSDQFSFCVALYEALYGNRPFVGKNFHQLKDDITREPVVFPVKTHVPRWLETIVSRGLSKDPQERYNSIEDLLRDLRNDPEQARINRRKRHNIALLIVLLSILPFFIWVLFFKRSSVCSHIENRLAVAYNSDISAKIKQAFLKTQLPFAHDSFLRVDNILVDYIKNWRLEYSQSCAAAYLESDHPVDTMVLRMACLTKNLKNFVAFIQVLVDADRIVVSKSVQAVSSLLVKNDCNDTQGQYTRIEPPANDSIRRRVESIREKLSLVEALQQAGKYQEGLKKVTSLTAEAKKSGYLPVIAESLSKQGDLLSMVGKYKLSEAALTKAAQLADKSHYDRIRAQALVNLIWVIGIRLNRFDEAINLNRWTEYTVEGIKGDSGLRSQWLYTLGNLFYHKGKFDQALEYLQRALTLRKKAFGPKHPAVAATLNSLGNVLLNKNDFDQALEKYQKSLDVFRQVLGSDHPDLAVALNNVGLAHYYRNDYDQALDCYQRSLSILKNVFGPQHPSVAAGLTNIGNIYYYQGDYDQALEYLQASIAIKKKAFGPDHPNLAASLNNLGETLIHQGRFDIAAQYLESSLEIKQKAFGLHHPRLTGTLNSLGLVYYYKGDFNQAESMYNRSVDIIEKSAGPNNSQISVPLSGHGWIQLRKGNFKKAMAYFRQVLSICNDDKCKDDEITGLPASDLGLAIALWKSGLDRNKALELAKKGQALLTPKLASYHTKQMLQEAEGLWAKAK